jgi:hypothetical protein
MAAWTATRDPDSMAPLGNRERIWQGLTALVAVLGLLLQFVWMQAQARHVGALWMTLRYFSYFTILSNVLVALVCGVAALEPGSRAGRWCMRAGVRGAVLLYILITAAVYHLLLAAHWHPRGLALLADTLLHTVVPSLYALGWLWIAPARGLRWRHLGTWLLVPVLYFIWAMLLGRLLHVYPYPFLNLPRLGMELLLRNALLLLLLFVLLGAALVLLDRGLLRLQSDARH